MKPARKYHRITIEADDAVWVLEGDQCDKWWNMVVSAIAETAKAAWPEFPWRVFQRYLPGVKPAVDPTHDE